MTWPRFCAPRLGLALVVATGLGCPRDVPPADPEPAQRPGWPGASGQFAAPPPGDPYTRPRPPTDSNPLFEPDTQPPDPADPAVADLRIEMMLGKRGLMVGDKLGVALRSHGTVRTAVRVEAVLVAPDGTRLRGRGVIEPVTMVEVFQGCDPVKGVPDSCKGGPYRKVPTGGGDGALRFDAGMPVLDQPGRWALHARTQPAGVRIDPVRFEVDAGPMARVHPHRQIGSLVATDSEVYRGIGEPRFAMRFSPRGVRADPTRVVEVIVMPATSLNAAKTVLRNTTKWDTRVQAFPGVEGFALQEAQGTAYRARWASDRAFVHVESHGVGVGEVRAVVDAYRRLFAPR